jgi:hypothetical protein
MLQRIEAGLGCTVARTKAVACWCLHCNTRLAARCMRCCTHALQHQGCWGAFALERFLCAQPHPVLVFAGQAIVQMAKSQVTGMEYAIKFFISQSAFAAEQALYLDANNPLTKFLPQVCSPCLGHAWSPCLGHAWPQRRECCGVTAHVVISARFQVCEGLGIRCCGGSTYALCAGALCAGA